MELSDDSLLLADEALTSVYFIDFRAPLKWLAADCVDIPSS